MLRTMPTKMYSAGVIYLLVSRASGDSVVGAGGYVWGLGSGWRRGGGAD